MRGLLVTGVLMMLGCGMAVAGQDEACLSVQNMVHADFALPRTAEAIAQKQLNVFVIGTGSSTLGGAAGTKMAYPTQLEQTLAQQFPGVAVKVTTRVKPRETATEMEKGLEQLVTDDKPNLVIWQTGTVDAMLGADVDEFRGALDDGIDTLHEGNADVVFMNMQYSPRTDSMIALNSYADALRMIAMQREVPLLDRFAIMKSWNESGTFDLTNSTRKTDTAERVHRCLGMLLASLIVDSAKLTPPQDNPTANKGSH